MQINIVGNIFNSSGYARHTRSLAQALYDEGLDVRLDSIKPDSWQRHVTDPELNMLTKPYVRDNVTIMIATPEFWGLELANKPKHFIGFLVWEGDKIPKFWLEHLRDRRIDMIFVPSDHTKQAILNTINNLSYDLNVQNKIRVVPHGVDINLFKPGKLEEDNALGSMTLGKPKLKFFANKGFAKGIGDRGGTQFALQAFAQEFSNKDNVELKIKVNSAYNPQGWNFVDELKKLNFPELFKADKPIMLANTDEIPYGLMPELYNENNVFLSLTMADGFGLPTLEAMACGLPTIQTNFGGQTDFVNNENGWLIDYELVEVKDDPYYEGIKWAKPTIEHAKKVLREIYNMSEDELIKKSLEAIKTAERFTWQNSAKKVIENIKDLN